MIATNRTCTTAGLGNATPEVEVLRTVRGPMTNYNYLVVDRASGLAVIVDPSWQIDLIEHALQTSGARLAGILLTHSHPDHTDLAAPLAQRHDCPIWMSHQEIATSRFRAPQLQAIDETPWFVGGMWIRPLLTPGHTPGCVCYLIGPNLFTGDVLFAEGCGICPGTEAAYEMFESLQRLRRDIAAHFRIYPGHSFGLPPGQLFSDVLINNIYLQFREKHTFAAFRLRSGQRREKLFEFH